MKKYWVNLYLLLLIANAVSAAPKNNKSKSVSTEEELIAYLRNVYEKEASEVQHKQVVVEWDVATDLNNATKQELQEKQTLISAAYTKEEWEKHFKGLKTEDFSDPILKREISSLAILGTPVLDEQKLTQLNNVDNKMSNVYGTGKICPYKNQKCDLSKEGLTLDPEIEEIIAKSTDYDELEYVWTAWRNSVGKPIRNDYKTYVKLNNEAATLNGFSDMGEMWRHAYESDTFIKDMDKLWDEVKPLYDELHTYVLNKLKQKYPQLKNDTDGLIPAHLLGNMWAQSWVNIYDLVQPYENASKVDATEELIKQNYSALRMFQTSNDFYLSLGLEPNDICYNVSAGAIIEKPKDREIICHASAWDFQDKKNYRVKMCTKINQEDFITIHHEMGHIQYYLLYKDQPIAFRSGANPVKMCTKINQEDFITIHHEMGHIQYFLLYKDQPLTLRTGANPGFHEAVGDTIALSVATPQHLEKIGLLKNYKDDNETSLNALMLMALERVAFLPFGLLIDKWRWDVFSGSAPETEWNARWWHYREDIQKVKSPNKRTEDDFDPGAKYHVPGNSQYIAYFVAHILEFQLHRSLCITAGQYDPKKPDKKPLHKCDIYQSKEAGAKLRAGLSLGASKHWTEALEAMTGETNLTGSAILEYFKPLYDYLKVYNSKQNNTINSESRQSNDKVDNEAPGNNYTVTYIVVGVIAFAAVAVLIGFFVKRKINS